MHKLPAEVGTVTGTVLARRLLESIRNLHNLASEERRSRVEIGPEGLLLHTTDSGDWHNPAEITIGPIPMIEAPTDRAAISTEARELALWAEHLADANVDDALRLTIDAGLDRRPGQIMNGRHEHLTCHSMLDRTTVSIPGYREPGTGPAELGGSPQNGGNARRTRISIRTKCLLKLLSRFQEIIPDSGESKDLPARLRVHEGSNGRHVLEAALAGPYAYMIQVKPLPARAAEGAETYIPWRTADHWIQMTRGNPALLAGTTTVTENGIETAPPGTEGNGGVREAAPIHIGWQYSDLCGKRFPKLDALAASHDDAESVTLELKTQETARALDFVCRALENRKSRSTSGYTADNEFVVWDFQANEIRALSDRLRIPLSKLCETHNRAEYKHLGPMELHSSRLRRIVDFWLRHGPASTFTSRLPVEYFMTKQRIRVRRTWGGGRATETAMQGSKPHAR